MSHDFATNRGVDKNVDGVKYKGSHADKAFIIKMFVI